MSEAIIAAMKMAQEAGLEVEVVQLGDGVSVTVSAGGVVGSVLKSTLDDAAKFIECAAIALGQPRTVSMEDARAVCEGTDTPSAGIDPDPAAASVTFKTIRDRVLRAVLGGEDFAVAGWALTQAAHELRQVPSQSFWNAADELEGIVRDKRDPHAEVPA